MPGQLSCLTSCRSPWGNGGGGAVLPVGCFVGLPPLPLPKLPLPALPPAPAFAPEPAVAPGRPLLMRDPSPTGSPAHPTKTKAHTTAVKRRFAYASPFSARPRATRLRIPEHHLLEPRWG